MHKLRVLIAIVAVCGWQCVALAASKPETPSLSAKGFLYVGAWPHDVLVIDESTEKLVDRIDLKTGVPFTLTLSHDRKTIYATTILHSGIEVIDLATRKVTSSFQLDLGNQQIRLGAIAVDPEGKYLYSIVAPATKEIDRFSIEEPKFIVVDLAEKKIVRWVDFPKDESSYGATGILAGYERRLKISPDGKFLFLMRENVLVFDTKDFKVVDKINLEKPSYPGMQSLAFEPTDDPHSPPGVVTSLFNTSDPYVHAPVFGIAQFNLNTREVNFTPVGPAMRGTMTPSPGGEEPNGALYVTPDRKKGYAVALSGAGPNRRTEFWEFDMETKKVVKKVEFDGRRRFNVAMSTDGKSLYVYVAGYDVEIYDTDTLKLRKTIDLNADATTNMVVVPAA
jgi:DNA-binding beta-propeller fold protein YncE